MSLLSKCLYNISFSNITKYVKGLFSKRLRKNKIRLNGRNSSFNCITYEPYLKGLMEMSKNLRRTSEEITQLYNEYVDMIYRIAFMFFKNESDTEDAVQAIFLKIIEKDVEFKNKSHEKAWIIVASKNYCKNRVKHWWNRTIAFDVIKHGSHTEIGEDNTLESIRKLPEKFKMPIYLYYYEGYSTKETAGILGVNESTLRSRLKKARDVLKLELGGDSVG